MRRQRLSRWLVRVYFGLLVLALGFLFYVASEATFSLGDAIAVTLYYGSGILALIALALQPLLVAAVVIDRRARRELDDKNPVVQ